jgi:hypothetical protein
MLKRDLQIQGRVAASDFFGILKLKENTAVLSAVQTWMRSQPVPPDIC